MLTKKDLELIRGVVKEEVIESVGTLLDEMILPRFNEIDAKFEKIDTRLDGIDARLDKHDLRFDKIESRMVTKDYLDDKFADFKAELADTGSKAEQHVKRLAVTLQKNGAITTTQFRQVFEI